MNLSRQRVGRESYRGSSLQELNQARTRAAALGALRASEEGAAPFNGAGRVTTLQELVNGSAKAEALAGDAEGHLLVPDACNPGYFNAKPLYDHAQALTGAGLYLCDIHEGAVLLPADTLVYWK
jgi:hypothetical protein